MDLILKYDPKGDILTMKLKEGAIKNEKLLDSDVLLGCDAHHELVAIDVWGPQTQTLQDTRRSSRMKKEKSPKLSSKKPSADNQIKPKTAQQPSWL